jgi:hypothetical protein
MAPPAAASTTLDTPLIPSSQAILTVSAFAHISSPATAQAVLSTLLDTTAYPQWNTFVPSVSILATPTSPAASPTPGHLALNSRAIFYPQMAPKPKKPTKLQIHVTILEQATEDNGESRICWVFDQPWVPGWMLYSERMHTIRGLSEEDGGGVEVKTWENFNGVAAYIVRWMYGKRLAEAYEEWVTDLKGYVEGGGRG